MGRISFTKRCLLYFGLFCILSEFTTMFILHEKFEHQLLEVYKQNKKDISQPAVTQQKLRKHRALNDRPRLYHKKSVDGTLENVTRSVSDERGNSNVNALQDNVRGDDHEQGKERTLPPHAGEGGWGVILIDSQLSKEQKWNSHFNQFVSDLISFHRSVPHFREEAECRKVQYRSNLPNTTVVIIFHNEAWSTLLRTMHSVLDRSPQDILQRVILVDDFSDLDYLKTPLDDYLSGLSKVTVLRSSSRKGLIRARLLSLLYVTTSSVVFLDSHCECFEGWLEPLLDPVAKDPTTVTVPVIEDIDPNTFAISISSAKDIKVGTFTWRLMFDWMPIQPSEKLRRTSDIEPIRSPTMAGGMFAIDRDFFYKLGTYDPGMKMSGDENLELSFKIWMCGGTMETIPCSRVGHVFRSISPHSAGDFKNFLSVNLGRLAAVWLDDYRVYSYAARGVTEESQLQTIGDVSERQALRRRLQCHSFGWFMKHVMPEMYLPADHVAHGPIANNATGFCISSGGKSIILEPCQKKKGRGVTNWYMDPGPSTVFQGKYELYHTRKCLDYSGKNMTVDYLRCHGLGGNQLWKYDKERKQLYHEVSQKCAKVSSEGNPRKMIMAACDPSDPLQQWQWDTSPTPGPSWRKDEAAGIPVL